MAIQMRRGFLKDFDPEKMLPGEWGVAVDADTKKQQIFMCFAPGVVKRLGTCEDFVEQIGEATGDIKEQYLQAFSDILQQIEADKAEAAEEYAFVLEFKRQLDQSYMPEVQAAVTSTAAAADRAEAAIQTVTAAADRAEKAKNEAEAAEDGVKNAVANIEIGGRNLVVIKNVTIGSYYKADGTMFSDPTNNWGCTDWITVSGYKELICSGYTNLGTQPAAVFFNADKQFIKGIAGGGYGATAHLTVPENAVYLRFPLWLADLGKIKLEAGNKSTDWTPAPEDTVTGIKGAGERSYRTGDVSLTAADVGALPATGGTVTGRTVFTQGTSVHSANRGAGNYGYLHIAQLKIAINYANQPIIFDVLQRGVFGQLIVMFDNVQNADPGLIYFWHAGKKLTGYIAKTATSTWDLYAKKNDSYDCVEITNVSKGTYMGGVTITWTDETVATLPAGAIQSSLAETESKGINEDLYKVKKFYYLAGNGNSYSQFRISNSSLTGSDGWSAVVDLTIQATASVICSGRIYIYSQGGVPDTMQISSADPDDLGRYISFLPGTTNVTIEGTHANITFLSVSAMAMSHVGVFEFTLN